MPKFALNRNIFARGRINVYNLLIDGIDQFELFEDQLEEMYFSKFRSFAATISQISENKRPPPHGKRRKIKGVKDCVEMRSNPVRLYYLTLKSEGIIICLGGSKNTQKTDIKYLNNLRVLIIKQIEKDGKLEIKK